jgi:fatty acid desaturase
MQYPGIGGRYFLVPMLAWFATLLVLAGRGGWLVPRLFARGLILCCALGVAADWLFMPYVHTGYHDAAVQFGQAPAGTTVIFEENPLPWQFTLTKR